MARLDEEEDGEWEICEAELATAVIAEPAVPAALDPEPSGSGGEPDDGRIEDEFELVDRVSTGDASCESDGDGDGSETPRRSTSSSPEDAGGEVAPAPGPAPAPEPEDVVQATAAVAEKTGQDDEEEGSDDGSSTTADEDCPYKCHSCKVPVFKAGEILSSNYHAHTSPGYLLSGCHNIKISPETRTTIYTTGNYTVQEVSCKCGAVLGITYSAASDVRNQYKVGKFLVGRDRLVLPPGVVHPMDEQH